MPDQLNKQALINLLIDSPLREPIKINLIDIVNNTAEPDLPKIYPTITKELEIFQKATERRMKLADETIAKLGGTAPSGTVTPDTSPMPSMPPTPPIPTPTTEPTLPTPPTPPPLSVPPLDLPPLPTTPTPPTPEPVVEPTAPVQPLQPLGGAPNTPAGSDEAALAEIQKELDSLKSSATTDAAPAPTPAA